MNNKGKSVLLTLTLFTGLFTSCNANGNKTETPATPAAEAPAAPAADPGDDGWKTTPGLYAEIVTSKGTMVIALEYKKVPVTVANFVGLAEGKIKNNAKAEGVRFFDGLTFHRCIHKPQPFMIQGGDPQGNGMGGPGYAFGDEFDYSLKFDKPGLLAMANSGPNTNGSQFFITEGITSWLDYKHTIYGRVVQGLPIVSQIENGEVMSKVNIIRVGKDAEAFDALAVWAKKDELLKAKSVEFNKQKYEAQTAQYKAAVQQLVDANKGYQAEWDKKVKAKYPKAKKTATGLYYITEQQGSGPKAEAFTNVKVHYTGTLWDGKKFDSSYDRNQPLPLQLGVGQVIPGWDEGIALFNQGGKGKLIIPFYLAYGDRAVGADIPAKSDLIFDVEVVEVK